MNSKKNKKKSKREKENKEEDIIEIKKEIINIINPLKEERIVVEEEVPQSTGELEEIDNTDNIEDPMNLKNAVFDYNNQRGKIYLDVEDETPFYYGEKEDEIENQPEEDIEYDYSQKVNPVILDPEGKEIKDINEEEENEDDFEEENKKRKEIYPSNQRMSTDPTYSEKYQKEFDIKNIPEEGASHHRINSEPNRRIRTERFSSGKKEKILKVICKDKENDNKILEVWEIGPGSNIIIMDNTYKKENKEYETEYYDIPEHYKKRK